MAVAAVPVQTSWCFSWGCPSTPQRLLPGPGSLWRSLSGTGARELDCLSPTAVRPVAAAAASAVVAAAAVAAAADFGAASADCH